MVNAVSTHKSRIGSADGFEVPQNFARSRSMAKKNSLEEYVNGLYELGMTGDEEAQLEFIRFWVTETSLPMPEPAKVWLMNLAEKGNGQARRCYFS